MANQDIEGVDLAASCSSSAIVSPKKYDVFISFRGEDSRTNFTSHLHEALCRNKIETYIDYRLEKGDEVWPALVRAIEDSTLFLVFSENYASSTWCLNELTKILERTKDQRHLVIPIFYKTDPSHVRKQKGTYEIAFVKYEKCNHKHEVPKWRTALTEAANLSGWHCKADRNEAELIREIIKCVLKKLNSKYTSESSEHVGIQEQLADLELLLFQESQDIRFIGIWGIGGIGKTTLAMAIFNKYCSAYEGFCFLADVREESNKYGITHLKNKLLSTLLEDKDSCTGMPDGGFTYVMRRIGRKKVLVVLDDVDDAGQIEKLAGTHSWFGKGSRVIITTRDKQVISKEVDDIYEVKALHFDEALQLFYLNAFKNDHIDSEFRQLSRRVVDYSKGNPLALKVLASLLYGKHKEEWKSQLEKLKKMPCKKIQDTLRLSYDGLDHEEKNIFLDVACFFKGKMVELIKAFLDACGYSTIIGLRRLHDKALLTISQGKVCMHDLIQEMGWTIVREESMENPEKRSRLWDPSDVSQVLKYSKATEAIRGITLDVSKIEDLYLSPQVFERMPKLKFLQIHSCISKGPTLYLAKGLTSLPNELRWLHWSGYPLKSLPSTFPANKLVTLKLRNSQVRKLWHGTQDLVNLESIDLSVSKHLIELPDFTKALRLRYVYLWGCTSLRNVHPSIFSLDKLEVLWLGQCESITSLRTNVHLTSLCYLSLRSCTRLEDISVVPKNMTDLDLTSTAIKELPSSLGLLNKLKALRLNDCKRLKNLPNKLADLKHLHKLYMSGCKQLNVSNLSFILTGLQSLRKLSLDRCCNLFELPNNICLLSSLTFLSLRETSVLSLPASIKHLSELEYLILEKCKRLRSLPELPPSIKTLDASDNTSLETTLLTSIAVELSKVNQIWFCFQNCFKLEEYSLKAIRASVLLKINKSVSALERLEHMNYKTTIIYPGNKVPEWFLYQTTQASITVDISTAPHSMDWGFIFCVIVSQSASKQLIHIDCEGYAGEDDHGKVEDNVLRSYQDAIDLNSDHVYLWYDGRFCSKVHERIRESRPGDDEHTSYNSKIYLKFKVYYVDQWRKEVNLELKGCGVCPTYASEYQNIIRQMGMELQSQPNLGEMEVGSSCENKDEKEGAPHKSKEFVYPTLPSGAWKIGTKGLKDIIFL